MTDRACEAASSAAPQRLRRLPSWLIIRLGGPANRLVANRLGRPGARADYALLASLEEFGPHSQAELGRRLQVDRSDMVALVNYLEEEGLAVRRRNERDRRRNAISITSAGRRALADLEGHVDDAQDELLAPLDPTQRDTLVALLQQLVDHHRPPHRTPGHDV